MAGWLVRVVALLLILGALQPAPEPAAGPTVRVIVALERPGLARAPREIVGSGLARPAAPRLDVTTPASRRYLSRLAADQDRFTLNLAGTVPGAFVERRYGVVLNAVAVRLPAGAAGRIAAMPGVRAVWPDNEVVLNDSGDQLNLDGVVAAVGGPRQAGAGLKIAIVDSGIWIDHPSFDPTGYSYPAGFPKGVADATNAKVIAARAYVRPGQPAVAGNDSPQPGPRASTHGMHVSSIAGGNPVVATIDGTTRSIAGVAPGAYLMNYRVFYPSVSPLEVFSTSAFSVELVAAIDDAVSDGADIINNSWGSPQSDYAWTSPISAAAEAAVAAGVVVVYSAGNDGPIPATLSGRSAPVAVIGVGAVTGTEEITQGRVAVSSPAGVPPLIASLAATRASFGPRAEPAGPFKIVATLPLGPGAACQPFADGALAGAAAIVARGGCPFVQKALNVQQAGGRAMILTSDSDDRLTASGEDAQGVAIPVVMLSKSDGRLLAGQALNRSDLFATIDTRTASYPVAPDRLGRFSSRGPAADGSLKPDVVAPGVNIVAAGFGSGADPRTGYGQLSGTSMAAPKVAGAAALIRQIRPEWTPAQVKSALMLTASRDVVALDGQRIGPLDRGAGRIDIGRAVATPLLADPPSLSFGFVRGTSTLRRSMTLTGVGPRATYRVEARPAGYQLPASGVGVRALPETVTLGPGEIAEVNLTISLPAGTPPADYSGDLFIGDVAVPYWVRLLPDQRAAVLVLDNDGSTDRNLPDSSGVFRDSLAAAGIEAVILDVDALPIRDDTAGVLPPVWFLEQYRAVIWTTGERPTPGSPARLGEADQNILADYLLGGGNLLAFGRRLAEATDINPRGDPAYGRSPIYGDFLGAINRRRVPAPPTAEGVAGTPLAGVSVRFASDVSIAVLEPYSLRPFYEGETDSETSAPLLASGSEVFGLSNASERRPADPRRRFAYRTAVFGFGLGDVMAADRPALLGTLIAWVTDP